MIRPMPVDQHRDHDNHDPPRPPGPPDHDMPQAPDNPPDQPHPPDVPMPQAALLHQHTFLFSLAFTQTRRSCNSCKNLYSRGCSQFPSRVTDVLTPPSQPAQPTVVVPTPKPRDSPLPPQPEDEDDDMSSEHKQPTKKHKRKQEDDSPRNRQSQPASASDHPLLPIASTGPSIPPQQPTGPSASPGPPDPKVDQDDTEEEEKSQAPLTRRERRYPDEDSDLGTLEQMKRFGHSSHMTKNICSNTGSFTVSRDINNQPIIQSAETNTNFSFFAHIQLRHNYDIRSVCHGLTDDDRAILTLYTQRQESLKASTTQQLIGKKRKAATQSEIRAYNKQILPAKLLECKILVRQ